MITLLYVYICLIHRWQHGFLTQDLLYILHLQRFWNNRNSHTKDTCIKSYDVMISSEFNLSLQNIKSSTILQDMVFTAVAERNSQVYTHINHVYHSMPETMEHRIIRSRMGGQRQQVAKVSTEDQNKQDNGVLVPLVSEFVYVERSSKVLECIRTDIPQFLMNVTPKVSVSILL